MAKVMIGLGLMRTPQQESEWRDAASRQPDAWTFAVTGDSARGGRGTITLDRPGRGQVWIPFVRAEDVTGMIEDAGKKYR
jgi:hypothetical protein